MAAAAMPEGVFHVNQKRRITSADFCQTRLQTTLIMPRQRNQHLPRQAKPAVAVTPTLV
jgi:hypothetical protein